MKDINMTTGRCFAPWVLAVLLSFVCGTKSDGSLIVSQTLVQNRVIVSTDANTWVDSINLFVPAPVPISETRINAIGGTSAQLTYAFNWSGDTATFRVDGSHTTLYPQPSNLQSGSTGHVSFTPMVDSLITLRVQYTYDLPGAFMEAVGAGGLSDDVAGVTYIDLFSHDFSFGPTSGSYDQSASAVVPAGCNCDFGFTMRLSTGATAMPAIDNGFVELSIAPLPEPATFLPLALAAMLLRRRRS